MTFNGKYNLTKVGKDSVHEKCAKKKKKRLYIGSKGAETKLCFVHKN